jgi:hypothetical protein
MTRYLLQFDSYGLVFVGRPIWRQDGSALASAVFLGSESLGTRDHILLSQIWDFHFRGLLRLAGPRWRYSTPPPHGYQQSSKLVLLITSRYGPRRKHRFIIIVAFNCCVRGNMLVCGAVTQQRLLYICLFRSHCLATVYMPQYSLCFNKKSVIIRFSICLNKCSIRQRLTLIWVQNTTYRGIISLLKYGQEIKLAQSAQFNFFNEN